MEVSGSGSSGMSGCGGEVLRSLGENESKSFGTAALKKE